MKSRVVLFVSLVTALCFGCKGLLQVNGKPVNTGGSKPSSESETTSENSESSSGSEKQESPHPTEPSSEKAAEKSEPAPGKPGKRFDDIAKASDKRGSWTPVQQYLKLNDGGDGYLVIADELGDKLSQAGRLVVIRKCLANAKTDATSAALWATCGADVEAFNLDGFASELRKEGIDSEVIKENVGDAKESLEKIKAVRAAVEAAAKDDPGVAAVVAMGDSAHKEWKAYASAHADLLETLDQLQDLVREGKNGLAGDCVAKTQKPFADIVHATKWPEFDSVTVSPMEFYANKLPTTTESYIAALAWAACATLTHESGQALYEVTGNTGYGRDMRERRYARRGPRTLTAARLFQDPFTGKFKSRDLKISSIVDPYGRYTVIQGYRSIMTPTDAIVAKLVKNGDETTIKFSGDFIMECTDWRDTKKISSVDSMGDVHYEKKCMHREKTRNEHSDVTGGTAFMAGLSPGIEVITVNGFPVVGFKNGKFVAALGVKN